MNGAERSPETFNTLTKGVDAVGSHRMYDLYRRLVRPVAIALGGQPWLPKLNNQIVGLDRCLQRATRGKVSMVNLAGLDGVTLTVRGVKSGIPRTTPLLCVVHDGGWLVAGSNWGAPKPPAWVGNLSAAETASVEFRGVRTDVTPREQVGEDRARVWPVMVRTWPNYEKYAARTGREIRVFFLDPS